jgi:radical SAM superfamily enzyme YgiQ (UPF0313 family)
MNLGIEQTYKMNVDKMKGFSYDMGPARPPSEGAARSLLIRFTRRCPWNRCLFCAGRRGRIGQKFEYKSVDEIKNDIDIIKGIYDEIKAASVELGYGGQANNHILRAILSGNPDIYGNSAGGKELENRYQALVHIANWIDSGEKTMFIQDSNSLVMRTPELAEALRYLKSTFPKIERITSYARAKTISNKSQEEMNLLYEAGLSRVHIGLESGADEVLEYQQKGATAEEQIDAGRKTIAAGIELSEYVMPGLGGKKWSKVHALESARVLNEIGKPDFIRLRTLKVRKGTPLYDEYEAGNFELPTEDEMIDEMELFIQNLTCTSNLVSDHIDNLLFEVEGHLPEDKDKILKVIADYKALPKKEKLSFKLRKYTGHYRSYGSFDSEIDRIVAEAWQSIENDAPDAEEKVEEAILNVFNYQQFRT